MRAARSTAQRGTIMPCGASNRYLAHQDGTSMTRRQLVGSSTLAALVSLLVMGLVFTLADMDLSHYGRTCTQLTGRVVFNYSNGLVLWGNPDGLMLAPAYTAWYDNCADPSQSVTSHSPDWSG